MLILLSPFFASISDTYIISPISLRMMKIIRHISALLAILLLQLPLTGCSDSDDKEPEPAPAPSDEPVERVLLVYMAAYNNLGDNGSYSSGDFDLNDIDEMKTAARNGAFGHNRLILFHTRYGEAPAIKEVTADGTVRTLKTYDASFSPVVGANMRTIFADVKTLAPASNYGLVLWSHGNGWLQTGLVEKAPAKRAFGDHMGNSMNVTTLAKSLRGENFDFVYFDCCFMAGVEVAYELRDVAPVIVASASELPSPGMPYDLTLPYLMADKADPEGAAKATFNHYNSLTGSERTCTMSVISTAGLSKLAAEVKSLYLNYRTLPSGVSLQQFVSRNDGRFYGYFYDLRHYLFELSGGENRDPEGAIAYENAVQAINECVTYSASTPWLWEREAWYRVKIDWHCGLSTYVMGSPDDAQTNGYTQLQWYDDVASALFQ